MAAVPRRQSRAAQLILASASPRRRQLLEAVGLRVLVMPADIDETPWPAEPPEQYVARLALSKARITLDRVAKHRAAARLPVLAADTVVTIDGECLGKPVDRADALAMLRRLSGRTHDVLTAVVAARRTPNQPDVALAALSVTHVTFRVITATEARKYWATGEPGDKAGAYGIQGVGGIFAEHIDGSFTGVMGLPMATAESLLRRIGVQTWLNR